MQQHIANVVKLPGALPCNDCHFLPGQLLLPHAQTCASQCSAVFNFLNTRHMRSKENKRDKAMLRSIIDQLWSL